MTPCPDADRSREPWRRVAAALLCASMLGLGVAAVLRAEAPPLGARVPDGISDAVLLPALVCVYLLASHLGLGFARKDSTVAITPVQFPTALGVVLVGPLVHLAARLVSSVLLGLSRRHAPLKVAFNLGTCSVELGAAAFAVSLVPPMSEPGPVLWLSLLAGLVAGEVLTLLAMNLLFRLLGMPVTRRDLVEPLQVALFTSAVFTGLAILTVSAAITDPTTLVIVVALAGGLAVAYRGHRRLMAQQRATEDLYAFVKDLGPVDVDQPRALEVLDVVRELMHAQTLELVVLDPAGGQDRRLTVDLSAEPELRVEQSRPAGRREQDLHADAMTTPLLADGGISGLLSARDRIGTDRGFDLRDLRLLETVATELVTAFDRGRLLRDLGTAASTDLLTGLPNLTQTTADLDAMLGQGDLLLAAVAVDSFREVNDTLGHQVGDDLLREVARRVTAAAPTALVGRIGGGRFAVAVPSRGGGDDAAMFGLGLRAQVEGGAQLGPVGTHVRLSVGCVRAPEHGSDAATLLRRAETAMYSARRRAHGGPVLWEPAYEVQGQRRLAVVMALREALASGAVGVAYQPKVSSVTGRVTGVEALARWTHPALGCIGPEEFVPLAEAAGLMGLLTSAVLLQALAECPAWQRPGAPVGVAVNVSPDTLQDPGFVTEVAALLASSGVAPGLLTLELTEDVFVADPELAAERMGELRALGLRLAVDDFGTGYSSLTYLKTLPIDEVKIDKGFVDGVVRDPGDQAVVRAVVDIAHTLGMSVVAEGVEQEDQQLLLRRLGVDEMQGFLHSRPMATREMTAWLQRRERMERRV